MRYALFRTIAPEDAFFWDIAPEYALFWHTAPEDASFWGTAPDERIYNQQRGGSLKSRTELLSKDA
jgi:hypothetical protein